MILTLNRETFETFLSICEEEKTSISKKIISLINSEVNNNKKKEVKDINTVDWIDN